MITMVSVALAISLTTGLGIVLSDNLSNQVEIMTSHDSILVSGLGLEKINSSHAFLYGMISNDGTQEISLTTVKIIPPNSSVCTDDSCILSASLDNRGSVCQIGNPPVCETCTLSCTLHPGQSMSLGPSPHSLALDIDERYGLIIHVTTAQGTLLTDIQTIRVR